MELFGNPPLGHRFEDPILLKEFILAGRAKVTVTSRRTGRHFTFKITKGDGVWFVKRLSREYNYIYIGSILPDKTFRATRKSEYRTDAYTVFEWLWAKLKDGRLHGGVEVHHENKCGRCGAELTDPESIKQGYGPECRKKAYQRPAIAKEKADGN